MSSQPRSVELMSATSEHEQEEQTPPTTTATTETTETTATTSFLKKVGKKIFNGLKTIYMFETGTFKADRVPEAVQGYLDGKTGFEMQPDFRFQDYDWTTTKSMPPGKNDDGIYLHYYCSATKSATVFIYILLLTFPPLLHFILSITCKPTLHQPHTNAVAAYVTLAVV